MIGYIGIIFGAIFVILSITILLYYLIITLKASDNFEFDLARQGNTLLGILLIYFLFFGFICNIYKKSIELDLIFLYRVIFFPKSDSYLSIFILMFIVFIITIREHFFEYAIRNSIWLVPIILLMSWIWHWIIYGFDFFIIVTFFTSIEGYLTILLLLGVNVFTSLLTSFVKYKYKEYIGKSILK